MKKQFKKFLSGFIIATLMATSIGFGDLETLRTESKTENVNLNALEAQLEVSTETTTGSALDLKEDTIEEKTKIASVDEDKFTFNKETGEITGYKEQTPPENLVIPETIDGVKVKGIGIKAFYYSSYKPTIKTQIKNITFPDGLEYIGEYSFQGNLFENIVIPDTVTKIEQRAFWGNQISNLSLPANLKTIGNDAFEKNMLSSINLPNGLESIGSNAFKDNMLTSINLPEGLKKIGAGAFTFNAIDSIEIPDSVNDLPVKGNSVFWRSNTKNSDSKQKFTKIYSKNSYVDTKNTQGIINPASVTVKYMNESGEEILPSKNIVGVEINSVSSGKLVDGDKHYLSDYNTPSNEYKDYNFIVDLSANYFKIGQEQELAPEEIGGYKTPEKIKLTLEKDNNVVFTYKSAGSKKLTLIGEGITSDKSGNIGVNSNVKVVILPPVGKVIDKLNVNGVDKKSEIQYSNLEYSYAFKFMEDTTIEAIYKDDSIAYDKEFKFEVDKTKFILGEKAKLSALYRGQAVDLTTSGIEFSTAPENILKLDTKTGEVRALKSGTVILTGMLKGRPNTSQSIEITVESFVSNMRVEGYGKTIAPLAKIEISDLDLKKYNIDTEFTEPKPIHCIIAALEKVGIDCADSKKGMNHNNGSYIDMIDGLATFSTGRLDGWMYFVDNGYANQGVNAFDIHSGQSIVMYFVEDYTKNTFSWFDKEAKTSNQSEEISLNLTGTLYDMNTNKSTTGPVSDAVILVDNKPYEIDGKLVKTDKDGNAVLKFEKDGKYIISAEKTEIQIDKKTKKEVTKRIITRPYCEVTVLKSEKIADKTKLQATITEFEKLNIDAYTKTSVDTFKNALVKAKEINAKKYATQIEADNALESLKNSILKLKKEDVAVQWGSFRGNSENHGVVNTKLPIPGLETKAKWIQKYGAGWSGNGMASIVVDDSIYIVGSSKLQKRSLVDGSITKDVKIPNGIDFYSNLGYGNGNIYVPSANGTVTAFDAKTLELLWTSESVGDFQNLSAVQYNEGLVYVGFTSGGNSGGVFAAFNSVTGNVEWKYGEGTSYYQTGAVVFGDNVIFAGGDGKLVSADAKTGKEIATLDLNGSVRCIPVKNENYVYLTTKSGEVYKVQVNGDGTFGNQLSYNSGTQGTTSPVVYNGRVYAGFGGMGTGGKVVVLDEAMKLIYEATLPGPTQSSPILTTGYADKENNNKVYVYFSLNNADGTIVALEDDSKNTKANVKTVFNPDPKQYSMSSPIAGTDGTIYYTNDSGHIFAIVGKTVIEEPPVEKIDYKKQLEDTLKYLSDKLTKPSVGNEWPILSLARSEYSLDKAYVDSYIQNVEKNVANMSKATDYERVAIAITALGQDAENIGGINLFEKLANFDFLDRQGINASIFGLIAANTRGYEIPKVEGTVNQNSKDNMLEYILSEELDGGGWALYGEVADPDITAMAIQSLAPYYKQGNQKVKTAVDRALVVLSNLQTADGDYLSWGSANPESAVQVLVALCELGKDPMDTKNGFVKDGKSLIDGIMKYKVDGGGFKHSLSETSPNGMATEQCAYGLVAYERFVNGKTSLYDMSDVEFKTDKTKLSDLIKEAKSKNKRDYKKESWKNLVSLLESAKKVNSNPTAKQKDIDAAIKDLESALLKLELKKSEKLELKDGKVEIPLDDDKNFDVELKADQKAQIVIPENTESKVLLKTESKKALSEIKVKKGKHGLKIPQGVKIEEGHAEIELFIMKTEAQKAEIKDELSDKIKKLDSKVKDVKVEDAFKLGNTDKIEFSDYVELVFTNMAGKGAAYVDDTGMHIIERVVDEKAGAGKSEYAFDRGNDLVVKTKHFTDFITYSLEKDAGNTGGGTDGSGGTGGSGGGIPSKDLTVTLSIDKKTINKGYVIDPTVVKINKGDTVWDVVKKEMESRGIDYRYNNSNQYGSVYVESIAGDGEFDHGRWSGWMYNVNGKYPNYGCSKYILNGGENVEWRYTTNLGEDLGQDNSAWGKPGESTKTETIEKGSTVLKSEAKVDKKEAKAEIDSKFIKGIVSEAVEKKLTQIVIEPTVEDKKAEFNKVSVVLEKESIEKIAKEAKASLKLKTKFGDVKLSANTLENLLKEKGNTVTISVKQNEDNTVTVEVKAGLDSLDKISGGMIVTLPVSEASASNIMVKVAEDNTEQIIMKSVSVDKVLSAKLDGSAKVKIVQRKVDFADTSAHWAKENIEFVSARDVIKGTKANEFSPNSSVNRAMLTTILHRFENEMQVEGQNYSDVTKEAYYSNAALWAKTKGIVSNTDKFEAKEELTREQIAEMIYNYAKASGENVSNISKANVQKFEDFSIIDSASQDAVAYCYEKGIIGGKSETKLDPKGKTTRAEVSAIIQRYIANSVK